MPIRYLEGIGVPTPYVLVLFQLLPALALIPFLFRKTRFNRNELIPLITVGFFMGAGFVLYSLGLAIGTVTKTVVLFYMTPIWSTIVAYFFLSERPNILRWFAIFFAILGCVLVTGLNFLSLSFDVSDLLGVGSGLFWAIGSVGIRRYPELSFLQITFAQYCIGGSMAFLAAVIVGTSVPDTNIFFHAVIVTFVVSVVIFLPTALLIFRAMQYVSPGLVGILMLSEVVVAAISASLFLGEILSNEQWLGVLIVLATGVFIGLSDGVQNKG